MGKSKRRAAAPADPKVGLEDQIMDGRVAKKKNRNKIRLRAEEESVIYD